MRSIGKLTLVTLLAAVVMGMPFVASAQDKPASSPAMPASPEVKSKPVPFHGKLTAVDKVKQTITVGEKGTLVIKITSDTKKMKNGKPAMLDDGVIGEEVAGSYIKSADGNTAKSIRFGAKVVMPSSSTNAPAKP